MAKSSKMELMLGPKQFIPVIMDISWWELEKYGVSTMDTGLTMLLYARRVSYSLKVDKTKFLKCYITDPFGKKWVVKIWKI